MLRKLNTLIIFPVHFYRLLNVRRAQRLSENFYPLPPSSLVCFIFSKLQNIPNATTNLSAPTPTSSSFGGLLGLGTASKTASGLRPRTQLQSECISAVKSKYLLRSEVEGAKQSRWPRIGKLPKWAGASQVSSKPGQIISKGEQLLIVSLNIIMCFWWFLIVQIRASIGEDH